MTETLYPLSNNSPFPPFRPLATTILLSDSVNFTTWNTSYKWNHVILLKKYPEEGLLVYLLVISLLTLWPASSSTSVIRNSGRSCKVPYDLILEVIQITFIFCLLKQSPANQDSKSWRNWFHFVHFRKERSEVVILTTSYHMYQLCDRHCDKCWGKMLKKTGTDSAFVEIKT